MKILYGTKINKPDYMEEVITENEKQIDSAIIWAKKNGYNRFRIANIDLTIKPDFIGTINK